MSPRRAWTFFALIVAIAAVAPAAAPVEADSLALITAWTPPVYPPAARQAKREGRVTVQLTVDEEGRVGDVEVVASTDPAFDAPAIAAVRQWKFQPARESGQPVPCALRYQLPFTLAGLERPPGALPPIPPEPAPRTAPQPLAQPTPDYPAELEALKISGEVACEFEISRTGAVEKIRVRGTTHPAFVPAVIKTLREWRYEPARQGRAPLTSVQQARLTFDHFALDRATLLSLAGLTVLNDAGAPDPTAALPQPRVLLEPVYPPDRFMADEAGEAEVEFEIGATNWPAAIRVLHASQPEFGAALAAAVAPWSFQPAVENGRGVTSRLRVHHLFNPQAGSLSAERRLRAALAARAIGTAQGLDEKLTPLWRVSPLYPVALRAEAIAGEATIEFVIDREGRVRLPRVVKATRPEFGWAAAMAASGWVFAPPHRGGQPVDVRVRVPFGFTPDA